MGFDITFHPIAREELQKFVFDVINRPDLANERSALLTKNKEKQELIKTIYAELPSLKEDVIRGKESFEKYPFTIASIAGFLHPFWYARGSHISLIVQNEQRDLTAGRKYAFKDLFESFITVAPATFEGMIDRSEGLISGNWTASGYIDNSKLPGLKNLLNTGIPEKTGDARSIALSNRLKYWSHRINNKALPIEMVIDQAGLMAINHAIDYALAHGTGLMEASDIVVPFMNVCNSDYDNFQADFLKTYRNDKNAKQS